MVKAPPWDTKDKAAILKVVNEKLQEGYDNEAYEFHTYYLPQMANLVWRWVPRPKEEAALLTSENGNLSVLVDMVNIAEVLPPAIRKRINEFLTQKRSLRTGRLSGGQKKDKDARRRINPVHGAAEEVPWIKDILKELYPKQSVKDITDRALWIAKQRHGSKELTIAKHLQRPKGDRRRV